MANGILRVKVIGDTSQFSRSLAGAGTSLDRFASAGKLAAVAITAAMVGIGTASVKAASSFEAEMSRVAANANGTAEQMARLQQVVLQLGKDTVFSAGQAAQAANELVKAGMSLDDTMAALPGMLGLAAAGELGVAEAAEITANQLSVFNLKARDAERVADVLALTANRSTTEVSLLGDSLAMAGAVASQAGMSLEETAAALGLLANNGIKGSDAGTSLKQMLLALMGPSEKAAELMASIGFNAYDASGRMKSMEEIVAGLAQATQGMTDQERDFALATIFGSDAVRAANILLKEGAGAFRDMTTEVSQAGAAQEIAAKKMDNLRGSWEQLKGSLETAAIKIGTPILNDVRQIVDEITEVVNEGIETADWGPLAGKVATILGSALGKAIATIGPVVVEVTPKVVSSTVAAAAEGLFDWGQKIRLDERWGDIEDYLTLHPGVSFDEALRELQDPSWIRKVGDVLAAGFTEFTAGDALKLKIRRLELGFTDVTLSEADVKAAVEAGYPADRIAALLREQETRVTERLIEGGPPDWSKVLFDPGQDLVEHYRDFIDVSAAAATTTDTLARSTTALAETQNALALSTEELNSLTDLLGSQFSAMVSPTDAWTSAIQTSAEAAGTAVSQYQAGQDTLQSFLEEMQRQIENWENYEANLERLARQWGPEFGADIIAEAAKIGPDFVAALVGSDDPALVQSSLSALAELISEDQTGLAEKILGWAQQVGTRAGQGMATAWGRAFAAYYQSPSIPANPYATHNPYEDWSPSYAEGTITRGPQLALIGEAGPELVLPLTNRRRSLELLAQSGLLRRMADGGLVDYPVGYEETMYPIGYEEIPRRLGRALRNSRERVNYPEPDNAVAPDVTVDPSTITYQVPGFTDEQIALIVEMLGMDALVATGGNTELIGNLLGTARRMKASGASGAAAGAESATVGDVLPTFDEAAVEQMSFSTDLLQRIVETLENIAGDVEQVVATVQRATARGLGSSTADIDLVRGLQAAGVS